MIDNKSRNDKATTTIRVIVDLIERKNERE